MQRGESLGTLTVSVHALRVLQDLRAPPGVVTSAAPSAAGGEETLSLRVDSITRLGAAIQRDPGIRTLVLSLTLLGVEYKSAELRKRAPPT